jgi:hypothetical protein
MWATDVEVIVLIMPVLDQTYVTFEQHSVLLEHAYMLMAFPVLLFYCCGLFLLKITWSHCEFAGHICVISVWFIIQSI